MRSPSRIRAEPSSRAKSPWAAPGPGPGPARRVGAGPCPAGEARAETGAMHVPRRLRPASSSSAVPTAGCEAATNAAANGAGAIVEKTAERLGRRPTTPPWTSPSRAP